MKLHMHKTTTEVLFIMTKILKLTPVLKLYSDWSTATCNAECSLRITYAYVIVFIELYVIIIVCIYLLLYT